MELISKYSYIWICNNLMNKKIHFISDCEFFPNCNVTGKVISYYIKGSETIFKTKVGNKTIDIGSNMKNLSFEIIQG